MEKPEIRIFRHRRGVLELGRKTRLMGIVNVTPDSFSDGGKFIEAGRAVEHALILASSGADILDIGAESTRPGSKPVSADEQLSRLLPVLEQLRTETDLVISIDTTSSAVARFCLSVGADVVNDVSGLRNDERLAQTCAEYRSGLVLMHMRGTPETMQQDIHFSDVVSEVAQSLGESVAIAEHHGVPRDFVLVDPGLGFGKTFEHNYQLMRQLANFGSLAAGVLVGPSRKAFTGQYSGLPPSDRQFSTAAAVAICVLNGADVVRVHDVSQMKQVIDICDRYMELGDAL